LRRIEELQSNQSKIETRANEALDRLLSKFEAEA